MNIALMSHDHKKELMVQFCIAYCGVLSKPINSFVIFIPDHLSLSKGLFSTGTYTCRTTNILMIH